MDSARSPSETLPLSRTTTLGASPLASAELREHQLRHLSTNRVGTTPLPAVLLSPALPASDQASKWIPADRLRAPPTIALREAAGSPRHLTRIPRPKGRFPPPLPQPGLGLLRLPGLQPHIRLSGRDSKECLLTRVPGARQPGRATTRPVPVAAAAVATGRRSADDPAGLVRQEAQMPVQDERRNQVRGYGCVGKQGRIGGQDCKIRGWWRSGLELCFGVVCHMGCPMLQE